jgi:alpha-tubulin suppressor-like RCC1 family protein
MLPAEAMVAEASVEKAKKKDEDSSASDGSKDNESDESSSGSSTYYTESETDDEDKTEHEKHRTKHHRHHGDAAPPKPGPKPGPKPKKSGETKQEKTPEAVKEGRAVPYDPKAKHRHLEEGQDMERATGDSAQDRVAFFSRRISSGPVHVIFAWGNASYGRLGVGEVIDGDAPGSVGGAGGAEVEAPRAIASTEFGNSKIASCCTSFVHSLAATAEGECFSWGGGLNGNLGCGFEKWEQHYPLPVRHLGAPSLPVRQVSCGQTHSIAVTADGRVYTWGCGKNGKLGIGEEGLPRTSKANVSRPALVEGLRLVEIASVEAGAQHCFAIESDGDVYAWGCNRHRQLALPPTIKGPAPAGAPDGAREEVRTFYAWPKKSLPLSKIGFARISSRFYHSLGIPRSPAGPADGSHPDGSQDGPILFAWGDGRRGKLGLGTPLAEQADGRGGPVRVAFPEAARTSTFEEDERAWNFSHGGDVEGASASNAAPSASPSEAKDKKKKKKKKKKSKKKSKSAKAAEAGAADGGEGEGKGDEGVEMTEVSGGAARGARADRAARRREALANRVVDVSAGLGHSFAVLTDGSLWAWGDGTDGVTGLSTSGLTGEKVSPAPAQVPAFMVRQDDGVGWRTVRAGDPTFPRIESVSTHNCHTVAVARPRPTDPTAERRDWTETASNDLEMLVPEIRNSQVTVGAPEEARRGVRDRVFAWGRASHSRLGIPSFKGDAAHEVPAEVTFDLKRYAAEDAASRRRMCVRVECAVAGEAQTLVSVSMAALKDRAVEEEVKLVEKKQQKCCCTVS